MNAAKPLRPSLTLDHLPCKGRLVARAKPREKSLPCQREVPSASEAEGFIYIVSSMGVTGVRSEIKTDIGHIMEAVKKYAKVPAAVGFGISKPEQAKKMADLSDGVIVGSAIVKLVAQYGSDAPDHIYEYVKSMKDAIR